MKKNEFLESVETYDCDDLSDFTSFVNTRLEHRHFVWRGQRDSSWLLEPTLDRLLKSHGKTGNAEIINAHLRRFKMATRGRRGLNPPNMYNENDWWALGQHNNLATPLLDWSRSPYVALFFAFQEANPSTTGKRAIFGLSQTTVEHTSRKISQNKSDSNKTNIVEFIEPLSDENARLVNQNGLFSRSPIGIDIETWVKKNIDHSDSRVRLYKIYIPEIQRERILQLLNRMNINHLSLFPDLYGASTFVNFDLLIENY